MIIKDLKLITEINVSEITEVVARLCQNVNYDLPDDVREKLNDAAENEESEAGRWVLDTLEKNLETAASDMIPICQDTGMAVIFLEIGQDVHLVGGNLEDAVNDGVRKAYDKGYLRKSVVSDPIERINTRDNTPAVIHTRIVPGNRVKITAAPKGFGSENMSRVYMLKPADGLEGVRSAIIDAVKAAGPNACPPMFIGVGVGGTFEKAAVMAKEALVREEAPEGRHPWVTDLEKNVLKDINDLGIGPGGLGGHYTALSVNINTYPTHIAGLPVAVNICCHVNRHATEVI